MQRAGCGKYRIFRTIRPFKCFSENDSAPYNMDRPMYKLILVILTDVEAILRGTRIPVKFFCCSMTWVNYKAAYSYH